MPIPYLNSSGKQLVDLFKEWIPKAADSVVGRTSQTLTAIANPGLSLGAYALGKLSDTHLGKVALKELDDISMAIPSHVTITPEIKASKAVASHMDDVMPMLGMAVPASIREYLFKPTNEKGTKFIYDDLKDVINKMTRAAVRNAQSSASVDSITEDATQAVVSAIADSNYNIPKHLEADPKAGLQHIVDNVANKTINDKINELKNFAVNKKAADVYSDKDIANAVDNVASQARNAEQAVLEAEKPIDKDRQAAVEEADRIFGNIVSPKMRAIFRGAQNRESSREITKQLNKEGIEISRGTVSNYIDSNTRLKIIEPISKAKEKGIDNLDIPDLQKLATSQRKMLGISPDDAVETLRRHDGTASQDTLTLLRRFMKGTPPSKLTPGKSDEELVKYNLTDLNKALQKLTDLKRGK